jgi:hypothetical protein
MEIGKRRNFPTFFSFFLIFPFSKGGEEEEEEEEERRKKKEERRRME